MKTSNKILVALGVLIIIGLYGFNYILAEKYKNGQFDEPKNNAKINLKNSTKLTLPDFRYLVVNGAILNKNKQEFLPPSWGGGFGLSMNFKNTKGSNTLWIPEILALYCKQNLKKDTLFITIEKDKINKHQVETQYIDYLYFSIKPVDGMYFKNGTFNIDSLIQPNKNLTLVAQKNAVLNVNLFKTDTLNVKAIQSSAINFNTFDNPRIEMLNLNQLGSSATKYTIRDSANIVFNDPDRFGKLIADRPKNFIEHTETTKLTRVTRGTIKIIDSTKGE